MKKKKARKQPGKASHGSSRLESSGLLPGLGGNPWEPPARPFSRMEIEQVNRSIAKLLEEKEFESPEEIDAFLATLAGRRFEDITAMAAPDPEEEAQDLAYEAMQAETPAKARALCRKALKLDPNCVDALVVQAGLDSRSETDLAVRLRNIVRGAEARFGAAYMEENRGHFWGLVETRPYMRARQSLVTLLYETGKLDEAIAECEGLLLLNPGDNQGNRDVLRGLYLEAGNIEGVRRLNKEYDDSVFAISAWSAVLERFLSGDLKKAEKLARSAHKRNRHVFEYLTGKQPLPDEEPSYFSPGDENEAAHCAIVLGRAWLAHAEAFYWLCMLKLR